MKAQQERQWLALHIFYQNIDKFDQLLNSALLPTVRRLQADGVLGDWFFLRYWEGGPHIRIRFLQGSAEVEEQIRAAATSFMQANPPERELSKEEYYAGHKFDGEPMQLDDLPWHGNGSIISLPYLPETDRYGGPEAMEVSEQIFTSSSEAVAILLESIGDNHQKRFVVAMDLMILTALSIGVSRQELSSYFLRYAEYWSKFVDDPALMRSQIAESVQKQNGALQKRLAVLQQFLENPSGHPVYSGLVANLRVAKSRLQQLAERNLMYAAYNTAPLSEEVVNGLIARVAFSQIHMTNNRLGINTNFEHYLGYMIHLVAQAE